MRLEKPNRNIDIVQFFEYQFEIIIIERLADIYFLKLHQNNFES